MRYGVRENIIQLKSITTALFWERGHGYYRTIEIPWATADFCGVYIMENAMIEVWNLETHSPVAFSWTDAEESELSDLLFSPPGKPLCSVRIR